MISKSCPKKYEYKKEKYEILSLSFADAFVFKQLKLRRIGLLYVNYKSINYSTPQLILFVLVIVINNNICCYLMQISIESCIVSICG